MGQMLRSTRVTAHVSEAVPPDDPLTVEDWVQLPEDVPGELVNGQLVEEEMAEFTHEAAAAWVLGVTRNWAVPRDGRVYGSDGKFVLGPGHGRKPDVSIYLAGRRPARSGPVTKPPDAVVEIVSPRARDARRDRVEKLAEYATFGIPHYWIVDPQLRTLEVFARGADGRYVHALGASSGRVENVPGCTGLVLDLDDLWAEIDQLDEAEAP